ncbi:hypothetical protein [Paenibacillus lautus]|uniref:hypothetical protein n=1 Tax=Paenibacillus lautus TaxID=1401 RepID=UPI0013E3DA21|nr:hypothetical protein [Paenibacillus lautus]
MNGITCCAVLMADIRGVRAWKVSTPDAAQVREQKKEMGNENFLIVESDSKNGLA